MYSVAHEAFIRAKQLPLFSPENSISWTTDCVLFCLFQCVNDFCVYRLMLHTSLSSSTDNTNPEQLIHCISISLTNTTHFSSKGYIELYIVCKLHIVNSLLSNNVRTTEHTHFMQNQRESKIRSRSLNQKILQRCCNFNTLRGCSQRTYICPLFFCVNIR